MADDNLHVPPMTPSVAADKPAPKAPPRPAGGKAHSEHPPHPKDSFRDIVETIVFVVVLVLLLKTFVAEAFVIPTGSMATTLWGYQKEVKCPQCGYEFPVNCSSEVDPDQESHRATVVGCTCPNCRFSINFSPDYDPSWRSGDRVLVAKFLYDSHLQRPDREDVVVFKYPDEPQRNHVARNYIKRLIGQPGETVGIWYGDIYVANGLDYPQPNWVPGERRRDLRKEMFENQYTDLLERDAGRPMADSERRFHIVRKPPAQILALSRIVYDNDHQAGALAGTVPPRWAAETTSGWQPDDARQPRTFMLPAGSGAGEAWLGYRHLLPPDSGWNQPADGPWQPKLITDFLGYNTAKTRPPTKPEPGLNWVGDLMLECQVRADSGEGELALELAKGADRFQARFRLADGTCTLLRNGRPLGDPRPTALTGPGSYRVRLANYDQRLTLWVDGDLPFGDGIAYDPPGSPGPTANDLRPARIGAIGAAVTVSGLKLYRDSYYTVNLRQSADSTEMLTADWADANKFYKLSKLPAKTLYVQPAHYLCLGDNSPESSDGRDWGLVPESLLLGRALVIYFPFGRVGLIK